MRISHDIREYAKENDLETTEAIEKGMKEKQKNLKKLVVIYINNTLHLFT